MTSLADLKAQLMEALSQHDAASGDPGGDIGDAARAVGISVAAAEALLANVQRDMGEQAR